MISKFKKTETTSALFFLAPSVIGLLIFYIIPFIWMIFYSFFDSPINGRFVGLQNYINLISNGVYKLAVTNTIVFTGISVPLIIGFSLLLSILLNKKIYFRHGLRTSFIVPLVVPVASVILFFELLFDTRGFINGILAFLNISPIDWLNSSWAMLVVIIIYIWKNIGYNIVLFLAGLQGIPKEYYEAVSIDGAGPVAQFFNITLIYLMPTTFFVIIISIINSFKVFREVYLLAGDYPHQSIYMLQHYMNNMFRKLDYHKLVTSAILMAAVIYLIVLIMFKIQKRINDAFVD
ncbi:carbohydrate ABC transporter permease [Paramaledivibacter caminithermalis]|uniref:Carbohydrate ABC transporter membrane protein 1, CUT1 family (TC 3.A.1.1.-) n=1 Tax=Paramaledivibacter caminithermalis (strain DSM 15212 / CIP 107654 / DViRD3) TaxID=1121301 RepID=A0A1M6SD90_PARC5|nr:sugar ABC transporter permease [Paramaledivibacter caminithermalis]SHK42645.1 carbohydrate ABC transporter membrane protein 1, CUT1 family (TC 3.A.1.1.-) [Paramaledivibacter caminithermalis DSM 15212]